MILANGGALLKIIRDTTYQGTHSSDTALNEIKADITISNNGTLDDFNQVIQEVIIGSA